MKKQLKSFSFPKFYVVSALLLVIPLLIAMPINLLVFKNTFSSHIFEYLVIISLGYCVHIPIHEGLHALSGILFAKVPLKDISFGIVKEQMMFYCHVEKPMPARLYRIVLITPFVVLGLIPLCIVTVLGSPFLVLLFAMCISGCAGDIVMFIETYKYDKNQLLLDHPSAPAYYLLYEEDSLPEDFVEVTDEQEEELQQRLHKKK